MTPRHKRLSAVRRHIQSLVASGPAIFYGNLNINEADAKPDPGAVVLIECIQCIALLQSSVQVLLYSLELVDIDKEGYFRWDVQEGVNCASHLRRVYEEIRQQRDVLGQHCFLFLSDYVWIYSGYGPQKRGIRREIDDALRPGVYALVDVSSANDLQYLHTVFGEGPCRSTLAALRQDYKLNFQYGGKV
ncbi:hypothetical protein AKJ16_DCAP27170 [Drosera capensis]